MCPRQFRWVVISCTVLHNDARSISKQPWWKEEASRITTMDDTTNNNHNNNNNDDDNSALDMAEQTERPPDTALHQQRIDAWHPILDPVWVIVALFYLGVILVPTGYKMDSIQKGVEELVEKYDAWEETYVGCGDDDDDDDAFCCKIGDTYNAGRECTIELTTTRELEPPILIHYELENFHQNHRAYYESRDPFQLLGRVGNQDALSKANCEPLNQLGNTTLNPCGLTANTLFNDIFELVGGSDVEGNSLRMIETGIAWQSDLQYLFQQPDGFEASECTTCTAFDCANCLDCCNETDSCDTPYQETDGSCWRYFYPEDDTTQYLYETYPDIISPLEGVENEHFIVWMRIATQPTFRKLYGWIDQTIPANETLRFRVQNNYAVTRFKGSKSLVVSTTSIFGGRNPFLAPVFIYVGYFCLVSGTFFALKQKFRPRKLADTSYLHYKED